VGITGVTSCEHGVPCELYAKSSSPRPSKSCSEIALCFCDSDWALVVDTFTEEPAEVVVENAAEEEVVA
jgi:hypothetical protein